MLARTPSRVRTVALHVPGTNTYLADGVWTHNDLSGPMSQSASAVSSLSDSGSSSSGSSSASKSSGSSFSGSSGSGSSGLQSPAEELSDETSRGGFSL